MKILCSQRRPESRTQGHLAMSMSSRAFRCCAGCNTLLPPSISASLWVSQPSVFYLITKKHWVEIRWMTLPLKNIKFLSHEKLLGCLCHMLWVTIHLNGEEQVHQFCSMWLFLGRRCSPYTSELIMLLLSAATSSINTNDPVPLESESVKSRSFICSICHGIMRDRVSPGHETIWQPVVQLLLSVWTWGTMNKYGCTS